MPREAEPSLPERGFLLQALEQGIRLDGRALDQFRDLRLDFGEILGRVTVHLGQTKVLAVVSAEATQPLPDRKFDGVFTISVELSPMASPAYEVGRQNDVESLLSRLLEKALRRSGALDTEALCIRAGIAVWAVRADVHVLDADGGLVDAASLAVLAALQHFRRPDVSVEGDRVTVHPPNERTPVPLALRLQPLCATLALFALDEARAAQGEVITLLDPTRQESQLAQGEVVVTATRYGEVVQVAKLGGVPADALYLLETIQLAVDRIVALSKILVQAVEADAAKRTPKSLIAELSAENAR